MANPWDKIHANNGLEVTIHLTPEEVGNVNGWVIRGMQDRATADYPPEIVLVARTRERFDDLAGQFVAAGLCAPALWWPFDETEQPHQPYEPPQPPKPPGIPDFAVDMQSQIAAFDYSRKLFAASENVITVFPFVMTDKVIHLATSEFQGQPWARLLTVSTTAGDITAPIRSAGKVPDVFVSPAEFPAGTMLYANNLLTEPPISGSSGSGFSIVW